MSISFPGFKCAALWLAATMVVDTAPGQTLFVPSGSSGIGTSSNGNVGIGTTAPSEQLSMHAAQGINVELYAYAHFGSDYSAWSTIVGSNVRARHGTTDGMELATNYLNSGASAIRLNFNTIEFHAASSSAISSFGEGSAYSFPRMVIQGDGAVGIGTTNPTHVLSLNSGSNSNTFRAYTAGDFIFTLAGDGVAGSNLDLFSIHNNNTHVVHLNTLNNARMGFGVSASPSGGSIIEDITIVSGGNVGIGTTSPSHKLSVNGTIKAKEVIVETTGWSDYVFAENYRLVPLSEVEGHIREKKHLPGIPTAAEVEQGGVSLGEMQAKLLAKIEELTLHVIALEKRTRALEDENAVLKARR